MFFRLLVLNFKAGVQMKAKWSFLLSVILLASLMSAHEALASGGHFKKVVWVVFENTNYSKALAQPDFKKVAMNGALFTNLIAEVHPSQGNYTGDSARCLNIEDETKFFDDFKSGALPEFSMYTPNIKNDGHDTGVDFAGKWLTSKFGSILSNPSALGDVLFIITFDESSMVSPNNQIYTVLVGANVIPNSQNAQAVNHPALLKMIEDEFGIGNLGREDSTAAVISGIWK